MAGRLLLDTSIIVDFRADDPAVKQGLDETDEVFVPSITVGELLYGARISARAEANRAKVEAFVAGNVVLNCDLRTGEHYAMIKAALRAKGRPIPENDIWIAAIALQHGLSIAARDEHFDAVDGLDVVEW
ncbi:MAG: type II toxin-antitoxin system VapC family toxin [Gemmatimonadota bacterium]|nr:type II toxin-antitoxin system VapC family toxin [Gemmatimonadota bacterium]